MFADATLVDSLLKVLKESCSSHGFAIYAFCFMPDHLHLILVGEGESSDLAQVMKSFKGAATATARRHGIASLWQKGYYDHILREGKAIDEAAWYVFLNPVRAGLVKKAEEWPYSGSFAIEWKRRAAPTESFRPPWKKETVAR